MNCPLCGVAGFCDILVQGLIHGKKIHGILKIAVHNMALDFQILSDKD